MTMTLDRTGATSGDFERISSGSEETKRNQTRPSSIADPILNEVMNLLDSVQGGIHATTHTLSELSARSISHLSTGFVQYTEGTPDLVKATMWQLLLDDRRSVEFLVWVIDSPTDTFGIPQFVNAESNMTKGDANLLGVISDMAQRLGLPMEQVLESAGIPSSTYYLWKKTEGAMKPRLSSHRRLWSLVQFVEDAEEMVRPSLQQWLLSQPERHALLLEGMFDTLLKSMVVVAETDRANRRDLSMYAVGGDTEQLEASFSHTTSQPSRRRGKVRRAVTKTED